MAENEYFDPRQLRSKEEQVLEVPEAPKITLGQDGALSSADSTTPVRVSGDIRYHALATEARTPMPEAWLAVVAGLVTVASGFATWGHASYAGSRLAVNGADLGGYGRIVLASGAVTVLLGLVGAGLRVGRLTIFAWVTGLAAGLAALDVVLKITHGGYPAETGSHLATVSHLAVPGLALVVLGVLLTLASAVWASKPRVGG